MVTSPGRRLALAVVVTIGALALLFSYRTSTSPTPVAEPAVSTPNQQTDGPRHRLVPDVTLGTAEARPARPR